MLEVFYFNMYEFNVIIMLNCNNQQVISLTSTTKSKTFLGPASAALKGKY